MKETADKLGKFSGRDPNNTYGYGVINVDAMVKLLLNALSSNTTANFAETHQYSSLLSSVSSAVFHASFVIAFNPTRKVLKLTFDMTVTIGLSALVWLTQSRPALEPTFNFTNIDPKTAVTSTFILLKNATNYTHLLKAFERSVADFAKMLDRMNKGTREDGNERRRQITQIWKHYSDFTSKCFILFIF